MLKSTSKEFKLRWGNWTPTESITRAEKLLKAHRNEAVIEALTPLAGQVKGDALKCRYLYSLGRALRKVRRWKKARPLIDEAVKVCAAAQHDLEPWARHLAGQAAERLSDETGAANYF